MSRIVRNFVLAGCFLIGGPIYAGTVALQAFTPPPGPCYPPIPDPSEVICLSSPTYLNEPLERGWSFVVSAPSIAITHLGIYDPTPDDGLSVGHLVGIWDEAGTLLMSGTVAADSPMMNDFRYAPVAPFVLTPNTLYQIGVVYDVGLNLDGFLRTGVYSPVVLAPEIAYAGHSTAFLDPVTLTQQDRPPDIRYGVLWDGNFGPNFQFEEVPEPSTLTLTGAAVIIACLRRRKLAP